MSQQSHLTPGCCDVLPKAARQTIAYITNRHSGTRHGWSSAAADVDPTLMCHTLLTIFFTKSISAIHQRQFADVLACSNVADYRCPMYTSAELYKTWKSRNNCGPTRSRFSARTSCLPRLKSIAWPILLGSKASDAVFRQTGHIFTLQLTYNPHPCILSILRVMVSVRVMEGHWHGYSGVTRLINFDNLTVEPVIWQTKVWLSDL